MAVADLHEQFSSHLLLRMITVSNLADSSVLPESPFSKEENTKHLVLLVVWSSMQCFPHFTCGSFGLLGQPLDSSRLEIKNPRIFVKFLGDCTFARLLVSGAVWSPFMPQHNIFDELDKSILICFFDQKNEN